MLIATFGPTTTWVGKTVTYADGAFVLEGHGPISAQDVFEYERRGHLIWSMDGIRAWVGARAQAEGGSVATPSQAADWRADGLPTQGTDQTATVEPPEQAVNAVHTVPAAEPADLAGIAAVSNPVVGADDALQPVGPAPAAEQADEAGPADGQGAEGLEPSAVTPGHALNGLGADDPARARAIEEAARDQDWARLTALYELQAWWLDEEGRDALHMTRLARRAELRALAKQGVAHVRVAAADDERCAACRRVGERVMTVADGLRLMPIPNASCAYKWCRCRWEPANGNAPR